jgi:hypothetical protein
VNHAIEYPKLRAKYGNSVKYAKDKTAHIRTEFGFDMVQVAKSRYASQQYHDFIGFQVSKSLLERVFPVVYGVDLKDVLPHEDLAIGSYRYSVNNAIPEMTRVALRTHILDFHLDLSAPNETKKDDVQWQRVLTSLAQLKTLTPAPTGAGIPPRLASPAPTL